MSDCIESEFLYLSISDSENTTPNTSSPESSKTSSLESSQALRSKEIWHSIDLSRSDIYVPPKKQMFVMRQDDMMAKPSFAKPQKEPTRNRNGNQEDIKEKLSKFDLSKLVMTKKGVFDLRYKLNKDYITLCEAVGMNPVDYYKKHRDIRMELD